MSRTQTRYDCDTGYEDGVIDLGAADFSKFGGTSALTRNAKGDISWHQSASQTCQYAADLGRILFRTGLMDYTQNRFGSGGVSDNPSGAGSGVRFGTPTTQSTANATSLGPGNAVNVAVKFSGLFVVGRAALIDTGASQEYQIISAIPDATHITFAQLLFNHTSVFTITQGRFTTPAGVSGPPPFTGVSQFTPPTSRPKGILIRGFEARYVVGTTNLTSISVGLSQTIFKNATALAITDLLAAGTNGLSVVAAATPYVIPVALASPAYLTSDLAEYLLEFIPVTPGSSTLDLYGVTLYVTYNYN